jgi:CHAT domain-containing protein
MDRILAALPSATTRGASLLHLSTHARNQPDVAIQLADGWLPLARILDNADGVGPGRPGGLVVVDACVTDVVEIDPDAAASAPALLDESLTLATGMLAAGAKHVIGTRWPVADGCAAVLAFHLHRHLAAGLPPAQALRAAQLDLLDGAGSPAVGGGALSRVPAEDLAAASAWAAYTHQGV